MKKFFGKIKGFTLIEILVVLIIIGILFSVTLNISGDQIGFIKIRQEKSQFVDTYNSFYKKNLRTKRFSGKVYKQMSFDFSSGSNQRNINYKFNDNKSGNILQKIKNGQFGVNSGYSSFVLQFEPLSPSCQIFVLEEKKKVQILSFFIKYKLKKYCFSLKEPLCQLQKTKCEGHGLK